MRTSNAEKVFRAKYPHARIESQPSGICGLPRFAVYAGDYPCAVAMDRATAFRVALEQVERGYISPGADEQSAA